MARFAETAPALLLLAVACGSGADESGSDAASSGGSPTPVAASALSEPSEPAPDPVIDLLHTVQAVVAVSSKVANAKDFPEHLVDGKLETAWNSKTGDLDGWIAFRVPNESRVTRIELTPGYDKGDLFTKNHRITRVRLKRNGEAIQELELDPEDRRAQGVDVDLPGGDFMIEVLATKPGSEKRWRELTVSELRVHGRAGGAPLNPKHLPGLAIGSLEGVPKHIEPNDGLPRGPFPSVAALCTAWEAAVTPRIKAAFPGDRYPGPVDPPYCQPASPRTGAPVTDAAKGPFLGATWLRLYEAESGALRLVLQTTKGYSITPIELGRYYHDDPGCGHSSVEQMEDATVVRSELGRDVLLIRTLHAEAYWGLGGMPNPSGVVELAYACDVDAEGLASCQGPLELGRSWGWAAGWVPYEGKMPLDAGKVTWSKRVSAELGPAGDLRAVASR